MNKHNIYAEISKTEEQDDGTIKVYGWASSPKTDSDGERVTANAIAKALPDYMKFGAVREMHQPKAAGTAIEASVADDGRTWFGAHVVDAEAVKKVQAKVYKGFSIGGKVLERDEADPDTITAIKLVEISLVDRPANPDAVFTMFKAEGGEQPHDEVRLSAIEQLTALVNKGDISPANLVTLAEDHIAKAKKPDDDADADNEPDGDDDDDASDKAAKPDTNEDEDQEDCDGMKAMKPEDLAKGLEEIVKAHEGQDLKKGLKGIMNLSAAIYQLVAVQASVQREAEDEGDGSAVPGQIADGLKTLLAALVAMAEEETSELVDDINQAGMESAVPDYSQFGFAAQVIGLAKAAKAAPEPVEPDLNKAEMLEKFSRLEAENASLTKRVKELEAMPAPPKGSLKVVNKGEDISKADDTPEPQMPEGMDPVLWEMKKVHRGGSFR